MQLKIEPEDRTRIKRGIDVLLCNEQRMPREQLQEIKAIVSGDYFEEKDYLRKCGEVIRAITASQSLEQNILKVILDLSRVHCDLQNLYTKHGLGRELMKIIVSNPFDCTDCNDAYFSDAAASWYVDEILKRQAAGMTEHEDFLSAQPFFQGEFGELNKRQVVISACQAEESNTRRVPPEKPIREE